MKVSPRRFRRCARHALLAVLLAALSGIGAACSLSGERVIYVTATPEYDE
ncbi:MAG: hypothetical protein HRF48_04060, partial [Chloroflexota bacterium]